ncbi:TauD/TfdA family dioxygenase, partial [Rhodococcus sp. NCIMB 12038]|uniref:TauD/TfdA dioxygenase family protein n=1 Tax=Rhodococcus sp. NCIMB 12038 TaxID=933800 RepID=UPI000B57BF1D
MTTVDFAPSRPATVTPMDARPLTCSIGAELHGVDLAAVSRDDGLFAELKSLLLEHKVLFFRDQDMSRAEHVALAKRFGSLEDHPVVGSDPEYAGLVRIYKDLDSPAEHYENAYHCDATWRDNPPMGAILRCIDGPEVGGDT